MEKQTPDYEKMAEEYAKVKPLFEREENADKKSDDLLLFYARISAILDSLPEQNAAKELVVLSKKTARKIYDDLLISAQERGLQTVERPQIKGRLSYTTAVRQALILSAKALEIADASSLVKYINLHIYLLSLTAF